MTFIGRLRFHCIGKTLAFPTVHYIVEGSKYLFDVSDLAKDTRLGGWENAVDVYVGYLRRKLEEASGAKWIHTVRGVGFKLLPPCE